ncbi:MAG TPA: hypothetical protein PKA64_00995 [Myxococcota bacterium]|nr:hypothetical protein [Myxococcota bacterium]
MTPTARTPRIARLLVTGVVALSAGCKPPLHLTYDYGRAYVDTLRLQADLQRPSVVGEAYMLYGAEGVGIRLNVQTMTSEAETGEATLSTGR